MCLKCGSPESQLRNRGSRNRHFLSDWCPKCGSFLRCLYLYVFRKGEA